MTDKIKVAPNLLLWSTHDIPAAFDHLTAEAARYLMRQSKSNFSIDDMTPLAVAAVAFATQLMIEVGHDPKTTRELEEKLRAALLGWP